MNTLIENIVSQNITLVYDAVDLQTIDTNALRDLGNNQALRLSITPAKISAVYPPTPTLVHIDKQRARIGLFQAALDEVLQPQGGQAQQTPDQKYVEPAPLWEAALACNALIASTLVAYGFNYTIEAAPNNGHASEVIAGLVDVDRPRIEHALDGELASFAATPRLTFRRGEALYDLVLVPAEEQRLRVTLNVHFEHEGISLPAERALENSYRGEFEGLVTLLPRLFAGEQPEL